MIEKPDITRAFPEDHRAVFVLLFKQFEEHQIELSSQELLQAIQSMLDDERHGFILLAWDEEQAIGVACVSFTWVLEHGGKSAWLDELYVLPEFRDHGVGSMLLEQVFIACRRLGCAAIDLEVEANHNRAEHLYHRYGFKPLRRYRWVKRFYP